MNTRIKMPIQGLIQEVEARMRSQFGGNPTALVATLDQLILTGGKRIRPTLTLLIGSMFRAEQEKLLNLAAAIEMLHTATMVHDDLVDRTADRRGRKTISASFTTSATVLAGDFAFAAAAQLAAATNNIAVMQNFSETLQFIVNGEITYMFSNGQRCDVEAYYRWIHAKTASVFEVAAAMSATIGTANPVEIAAAHQFGYNLGMAFHITNDVQDFTGDPSILGKPIGSDLRQGILTLPTILYLDSHPTDLDNRMISKGNGFSSELLDELISSIRQSDAIDEALGQAQHFLQQASDTLLSLPDTPERTQLEVLVSQVIHQDFLKTYYPLKNSTINGRKLAF